MKVGDRVPVTIAGQTVANATVRELGDGTATLVVPATLVVMATRTELTVETPAEETATETQILGVESTSGGTESAPVGESNSPSSENVNTSTETTEEVAESGTGELNPVVVEETREADSS